MTQREAVLGLVGMELIIFMAAHMVLCFGFVYKTVQKTHQCTGPRWAQCQDLLCFSLCTHSEKAESGQEVGREHSQDCWPHLTMEYSIKYRLRKKKKKPQEKKEKQNKTKPTQPKPLGVVFPKQGLLGDWLVHHTAGGREGMTAFPLPGNFYSDFLHLLNYLNLDLQVFLGFALLILFQGSEWQQEPTSKETKLQLT